LGRHMNSGAAGGVRTKSLATRGSNHHAASIAGRGTLTAGLGGMGGAQPLAAPMAGACCLAVECRPSSIEFRLRTGYLDSQAKDLDEALSIIAKATAEKKAVSVGLLGNAAGILPALLRPGVRPGCLAPPTPAPAPA